MERPDLEAAEAEAFEYELTFDCPESVDQVAGRFDLPVQWAQMHVGEHRCVDGRMYRVSCLVTDPSCDRVARSYMRAIEERTQSGGLL